jgi:hypothetical protein
MPSASRRSALHFAAHDLKISSEQSVAPFQENLKISIDTLVRVRLKDAPSPALAGSEAGDLTTGKNKKSGKLKKVLTRFWRSARSHVPHSNSIHFKTIHEKEIHFAIRIL